MKHQSKEQLKANKYNGIVLNIQNLVKTNKISQAISEAQKAGIDAPTFGIIANLQIGSIKITKKHILNIN